MEAEPVELVGPFRLSVQDSIRELRVLNTARDQNKVKRFPAAYDIISKIKNYIAACKQKYGRSAGAKTIYCQLCSGKDDLSYSTIVWYYNFHRMGDQIKRVLVARNVDPDIQQIKIWKQTYNEITSSGVPASQLSENCKLDQVKELLEKYRNHCKNCPECFFGSDFE